MLQSYFTSGMRVLGHLSSNYGHHRLMATCRDLFYPVLPICSASHMSIMQEALQWRISEACCRKPWHALEWWMRQESGVATNSICHLHSSPITLAFVCADSRSSHMLFLLRGTFLSRTLCLPNMHSFFRSLPKFTSREGVPDPFHSRTSSPARVTQCTLSFSSQRAPPQTLSQSVTRSLCCSFFTVFLLTKPAPLIVWGGGPCPQVFFPRLYLQHLDRAWHMADTR